MSNDTRQFFTTPVGRFVSGNLYTPQTKDADGKPLLIKNGPDTGKPTQKFTIAIAIPKIPGQHWANYPRDPKRPEHPSFGEAIWSAGHSSMGAAAQAPVFAWKVTDGDSQIPNRKGKKPADQEGYAGCWVVWCSGSFAPKTFNADGTQALLEKDAIKPGYYVQIAGNVDGNRSSQNPGVFINPSMVALQAFGEEIMSGPDATAVGFGGAALPAGASPVPVGQLAPPPPAAQPAAPGMTPPPPVAAAAAVPVAPNPAFLAPPPAAGAPVAPFPPAAASAAPPPPPAPPAAPVRHMLPAAGVHTYDALRAAGWTDEALRAAHMMA